MSEATTEMNRAIVGLIEVVAAYEPASAQPVVKRILFYRVDEPYAELVEHTAKDRYWGDGGDGGGRNRLGHLLMELREQLRTDAVAH